MVTVKSDAFEETLDPDIDIPVGELTNVVPSEANQEIETPWPSAILTVVTGYVEVEGTVA